MRRTTILVVVALLIGLSTLVLFSDSWLGGALGALGWIMVSLIAGRLAYRQRTDTQALYHCLIAMGDALQEVSTDNLRKGWQPELFNDVLRRVEQQTPDLQAALVRVLDGGALSTEQITALLDVDRLSAAYTYWTRLFPPRQREQTMFVLSLLHDLSDKVEYAIRLIHEGKH